jgi:hypothetical protein
VIVLDRGELLFDGTPEAFMRDAGESVGPASGDLERALVAFLERHGR